jgi:S1-C subfamily serine protease
MCMAIKPRDPAPQPPPATVPTGKKVVTTPAPPPPAPTPNTPAPRLPTPLMPPGVAPAAPEPTPVERARQGVVVLERAGKPLALGFVIDGDGRILTALSPLTNGNFLTARYQDGTVIPLKLVLGDRGWDLALLTPVATQKEPLRKAGLRAAKLPSFLGLQSFNLAPPNTLTPAPATLTLSPTLLGGDATTLANAYVLGAKPALIGGPIISAEGEVIALVARACPADSKPGCVPAPYAAPVPAIKQFLQRVPSEATWLGVEVAHDETRGVRGVRVVSVIPNSPAAMAGIRPGAEAVMADIIVAVDGTPVAGPADLNEAVRARTTGDTVELLLFGLGRYRNVSVKPRPAPQLTAPPYAAPKPGKPRTPNPYR